MKFATLTLVLLLSTTAAQAEKVLVRIWNDSPTELVQGFIFPDAKRFRIPPLGYIDQFKTVGGTWYAAFGFNNGGGSGEFTSLEVVAAGGQTTVLGGLPYDIILGPNRGDGVKFDGIRGGTDVPPVGPTSIFVVLSVGFLFGWCLFSPLEL